MTNETKQGAAKVGRTGNKLHPAIIHQRYGLMIQCSCPGTHSGRAYASATFFENAQPTCGQSVDPEFDRINISKNPEDYKHPVTEPAVSPFDEMAAYQPGRSVHASRPEITAENSNTILTHAIQHLRRTQLNCRTWTMPAGDEQAINLMLDLQR